MQRETATHAFALPAPSQSTEGYVAWIRSLLHQEGRSAPLCDLKSKFEGTIPRRYRLEVLVEVALPCWANASAYRQSPHSKGRVSEVPLSTKDGHAAQDSVSCILADALALAVLAEAFDRSELDQSGPLSDVFRDSIIALQAGLAGSQSFQKAGSVLDVLLHCDGKNFEVLLRFTALELIATRSAHFHETGQAAVASTLSPENLNDGSQLLSDAAQRSLSMGELRRAREGAQNLPKRLLPSSSIIAGISQGSSVLSFEVLCRAADLCSPDELIYYLSELRFLSANMRTFDLLLRLLRLKGDSPGQEKLASAVRPYVLAPFLEFALNRSTQESQSGQSEEEGRHVKLTCQFLTALLDAALLTSPATSTQGEDLQGNDHKLAEADGLKEAMLLVIQEFALAHSRFREASELYARVVRM